MVEAVLDSSALLALLLDEPGGELVAGRVGAAVISAVNLAEVISRLVDLGLSDEDATRAAFGLECTVVAVDADLALRAGRLRRTTRQRGLSLGDRICIALALREDLPVLTSDQAWAELDVGAQVVLIR